MDRDRSVLALEGIKEAKARYCRGVDTKDWDLFASAFAADATLDLRDFQFSRDPATGGRVASGSVPVEVLEGLSAGVEWPVAGRDEIVSVCRLAMDPVVSAHHVMSPEIELVSPSSARAVWAMEDYTWYPEGAPVRYMHGFGHYTRPTGLLRALGGSRRCA
jgi:hypothetical protein